MTFGSANLPHLTRPQAMLLTLWSCGIACTSCADGAPLRPCYAAAAGEGRHGRATPLQMMSRCLRHSRASARRAACDDRFRPAAALDRPRVARRSDRADLDATTGHDCLVALVISVVDRGCAIPVAWTVLPAGPARAWRGEWTAPPDRC